MFPLSFLEVSPSAVGSEHSRIAVHALFQVSLTNPSKAFFPPEELVRNPIILR